MQNNLSKEMKFQIYIRIIPLLLLIVFLFIFALYNIIHGKTLSYIIVFIVMILTMFIFQKIIHKTWQMEHMFRTINSVKFKLNLQNEYLWQTYKKTIHAESNIDNMFKWKDIKQVNCITIIYTIDSLKYLTCIMTNELNLSIEQAKSDIVDCFNDIRVSPYKLEIKFIEE